MIKSGMVCAPGIPELGAEAGGPLELTDQLVLLSQLAFLSEGN